MASLPQTGLCVTDSAQLLQLLQLLQQQQLQQQQLQQIQQQQQHLPLQPQLVQVKQEQQNERELLPTDYNGLHRQTEAGNNPSTVIPTTMFNGFQLNVNNSATIHNEDGEAEHKDAQTDGTSGQFSFNADDYANNDASASYEIAERPHHGSAVPTIKSHIEVIPCKICGDKSSGVHYGIITCEGCKGFFRRSQASPVAYQCPRNKACAVDRVNRNRCQYCRLQKCLALGMSRDAVKFGRMSKKQRERVEDEANYHKRRLSAVPTSEEFPDSYEPYRCATAPAASSLTSPSESLTNNNNTDPSSFIKFSQNLAASYGLPRVVSSTAVDVKHLPQQFPTSIIGAVSFNGGTIASPADIVTTSQDGTAGVNINLVYRQDGSDGQAISRLSDDKLDAYRRMNHEEVWMMAAERLTDAVQEIIEFAKLVPGFINLMQDDQIMLLKGGSFEIALLRFSQLFDIETNSVRAGSYYVPLNVFTSLSDEEVQLLNDVIEFFRQLVTLKLSDVELALLCSVVLINPKRPGIKDALLIQKLNERIDAALKLELLHSHPVGSAGNAIVDVRPLLATKIAELQLLSFRHMNMLARFKEQFPSVEFPALHKELFSQEGVDGV